MISKQTCTSRSVSAEPVLTITFTVQLGSDTFSLGEVIEPTTLLQVSINQRHFHLMIARDEKLEEKVITLRPVGDINVSTAGWQFI